MMISPFCLFAMELKLLNNLSVMLASNNCIWAIIVSIHSYKCDNVGQCNDGDFPLDVMLSGARGVTH